MSQPGRTPLLDDFKQGEVCAILTMGGSRRTAAKYVGCSPDAIRRTAENNEDFRQRLQRAESNLELHHLGKIKDAAEKNWRASAWVLERVHPERFAKRDPGAIMPEQLAAVVSCTVDILIEEVPQVEHQRVLKRVDALVAELLPGGNGNNGNGHHGNGHNGKLKNGKAN